MALRERLVQGIIVDADGTPITNAKVKFKINKPLGFTTTHVVIDKEFEAITDSGGAFSKTLWCDEDSLVAIDYNVYFPTTNNGEAQTDHSATFSLNYDDGSPIDLSVVINLGIPVPPPSDPLYVYINEQLSWGNISGIIGDQTDLINALNTKIDSTRQVNSGIGLSGGGNLSVNRTLAVDIPGLTEQSTADDGDFLMVYSFLAPGLRKMSRLNFLSGIGGGGASSPLVLDANTPLEVPLTILLEAGHSVNAIEVKNSGDSVVFRIDQNGYIYGYGTSASILLSDYAGFARIGYNYNSVQIGVSQVDFFLNNGQGATVGFIGGGNSFICPVNDNIMDVGKTAARWRNMFMTGYIEMYEMSAPPSPPADGVRLYPEDNGSGKTRLMALFSTGAAQQVAIQP